MIRIQQRKRPLLPSRGGLVGILCLSMAVYSRGFTVQPSTFSRPRIVPLMPSTSQQVLIRPRLDRSVHSTRTPTSLNVFRGDPREVIKLTSPLMTTSGIAVAPVLMAPLLVANQGSTALASVASPATPFVEAQILTDMSHVALDLATFLGPSMVALRFAAVVGRLMLMAADFIPDHFMLPEEFAFQFLMLAVAWVGLIQAALPLAVSHFASDISLRDRKAYVQLFKPAGVTWNQFKALSVYALDWGQAKEGERIASDELPSQGAEDKEEAGADNYVYWLYSGQAVVQSNDQVLHRVVRKPGSKRSSAGMGLLGEMSWITEVEGPRNGSNGVRNSSADSEGGSPTKESPRTTAIAGEGGATVLKIHKDNLAMLMKQDKELEQSIRTLMIQCMQDKLAARLETEQP